MNDEFEALRRKFILDYKTARPVMTILGDEVRQEIMMTLIETGGVGGIRVGEIQRRSNVSRSAVSHHLKVLLDAKLITIRKEGTKNYYYIDANSTSIKPLIRFWQEVEPMLSQCNKLSVEREKI